MKSLIISGIKASGKSRIIDELSMFDRYKNSFVLIDLDVLSTYIKSDYYLSENVVEALVEDYNIIASGNMCVDSFDEQIIIKMSFQDWKESMGNRIQNGRVNSSYSNVSDKKLFELDEESYYKYRDEKFSKIATQNALYMSYDEAIKYVSDFMMQS